MCWPHVPGRYGAVSDNNYFPWWYFPNLAQFSYVMTKLTQEPPAEFCAPKACDLGVSKYLGHVADHVDGTALVEALEFCVVREARNYPLDFQVVPLQLLFLFLR